jgi:hypothetical protein
MNKLIVLISLIMLGCTSQPHSEPVAITKYAGWFYNDCLAIQAPNLVTGTNVTLIDSEDTDSTHNSKVLGPARTADECPALADDRKSVNTQDNKDFYLISKSKTIKAEGFFIYGVALVISDNKTFESISETLDLNNDGIQDSFSSCASSEGINFDIWSATPYKSKNIWNGYYYLGYDIDPNCPDM